MKEDSSYALSKWSILKIVAERNYMEFRDVASKVIKGTFKVVCGTCEFLAESGNTTANLIDRMSDEEVEKKYPNTSVEEMRNLAAEWHYNYERIKK